VKKTTKRALQLHTQTIRMLQTSDLPQIAGGVTYTCKPSTQNPTDVPANPVTWGCWLKSFQCGGM
jgi:hypothetical protein